MFVVKNINNNNLFFVKSSVIQAFPCGRRRSTAINNQVLPFDPEARLNTEANNRKHSSLNGFTQTYLEGWDNNGIVTLSMAGYYFKINLAGGQEGNNYQNKTNFGNTVANGDADVTKVYANIVINDAMLFSNSTLGYYTSVLGTQVAAPDGVSDDALDLHNSGDSADPENYYFSGLSFSAIPTTSNDLIAGYDDITNSYQNTWSTHFDEESDKLYVSLCILEKVNTEWQLYQPALLPNVRHDNTTDSVVVKTFRVEDSQTINRDLAVEGTTVITGKLTAEDELQVAKTVTVGDGSTKITVKADNTTVIEANDIKVDEITGKAANGKVSKITADVIDTMTATAHTEITSPRFTQVVNGNSYQVPYITLAGQTQKNTSGQDETVYQLQISRIGTKST